MSGLKRSMSRPDDPRGIRCPACGCSHLWVVYTRPALWGRIVRRRECRHCGHRVTTSERVGPIAGQPLDGENHHGR